MEANLVVATVDLPTFDCSPVLRLHSCQICAASGRAESTNASGWWTTLKQWYKVIKHPWYTLQLVLHYKMQCIYQPSREIWSVPGCPIHTASQEGDFLCFSPKFRGSVKLQGSLDKYQGVFYSVQMGYNFLHTTLNLNTCAQILMCWCHNSDTSWKCRCMTILLNLCWNCREAFDNHPCSWKNMPKSV